VCSRVVVQGLYVRPVVFTGISNQSRVAREEIFGPVTCVFKVPHTTRTTRTRTRGR
jgi:acyl-CoA reductase-like NAD-dependent aldehyde dehydrogenase